MLEDNKPRYIPISLTTYSRASSSPDQILKLSVDRIWEIEQISNTPITNPEDDYCEQHFVKTHRRTPSGRYIVQIPFKSHPSKLEFPNPKQ